ncbi:MAG TPA: tRNA glutamyl-Q(34) synthetase GluQRS [Geminicoccus sp.]|jgi:glutamyl-Q tRNA(Asp) synthetase|uniref:tRNA glutamyl-Q(34) synthetase GluQRS n=1 Tax=Geminicoccus sp. TaxID=2024832 RepID=UPI002E3816E8|nr:tRNA glutamyl-Q(34) synthetase GluQRS [Geminicoccus sp.]HEX2528060.1 tRNA glutamyl-Q(34) synthetase GluQRS [Geminicoccus sp.]
MMSARPERNAPAGERAGLVLAGHDRLPEPFPDEPVRVTRFAPSPTGYLHLGHAYSAQFAHDAAVFCGGRFLVRIEDIDVGRCRPEFTDAIFEDLNWLGLRYERPVRRQSEHLRVYEQAIEWLDEEGLVYPCFCTRRQVKAEVEDAGRAPHGPSGEPIYPGTCRNLDDEERRRRIERGEPFAWRLDVGKCLERTGALSWFDCRAGEVAADPLSLGDIVLGRKDVRTSYHLAVTVDDALQGVTLVTRGEDLFHATHIHRLLQAVLGLKTPRYYHHNLLVDRNGQRMSKRNRAVTLRHFRDTGHRVEDLFKNVSPSSVSGDDALKGMPVV